MEFILIPTEKLIEWDKNPRFISVENFEKLKVKLYNKAQFKPLLVTPTDDGKYIVLAGNMRLRAYRELGVEKLWIRVLEFQEINDEWIVYLDGEEQAERFKSKEDAMMDWSLSENERLGQYDMDQLANDMASYAIDWGNYSIDAYDTKTPSQLIDEYGLGKNEATHEDDDQKTEPKLAICPNCGNQFTV